ncbi:MAG: hypothetical protein IJS82_00385 [Paludibacteraceae bacterium]|nr:hypothetical protein [Paludibacteraceae bacterium]
MDLQELEKQYEAAKKALQEVGKQIADLFLAAGEKFETEAEEGKPAQPAEPVQPEKTAAPQPAPQPVAFPDLEKLLAKLDTLLQANEKLQATVDAQKQDLETLRKNQEETVKSLEEENDSKQDRLENIIQTVQEDRYRKDKLKLINRCIFQSEMLRKTIYEYPDITKDMTLEEKEAFLLKQLNSVVIGYDSMLADEGAVVTHFAAVGEKMDKENQEAVGARETGDEALNGTVAEVISPGYVWTLPYILKAKVNESGEEIKRYKFLMQTEKIIAYKFVKQS